MKLTPELLQLYVQVAQRGSDAIEQKVLLEEISKVAAQLDKKGLKKKLNLHQIPSTLGPRPTHCVACGKKL